MRDLQARDERQQTIVVKPGQSADGHARFRWAVGSQAVEVEVGRDEIYTFELETRNGMIYRCGYLWREFRVEHLP